MKYFILLLKLCIFTALVLIRLGEWDVSWLYANSKYREAMAYYVDALASIASFLMFLDFVQFTAVWWYRKRHKVRGDDNFIIGVSHIYSLLLAIGLIVGILSLFRINVRELFTSLSIIFAGLAILTKDYISNMINGMIMTFSGQLSIGDNIRIGHRVFFDDGKLGGRVAVRDGEGPVSGWFDVRIDHPAHRGVKLRAAKGINVPDTTLPISALTDKEVEHLFRIIRQLREAGNTAAELVLIKTGTRSPDNNNPCRSGYHMYYGAGPDVAKVLDQFMNKHLGSR